MNEEARMEVLYMGARRKVLLYPMLLYRNCNFDL